MNTEDTEDTEVCQSELRDGVIELNSFSALLSEDASAPSEQAKHLSIKFAVAVSNSRLRLWKPGDPIASEGRRVLIGVAPYSVYDLKLLDILNSPSIKVGSDIIEVFDVLSCPTQDEIAKYIPDIGNVYQTPFVGVWSYGRLEEKRSGHSARELILELYGRDDPQQA